MNRRLNNISALPLELLSAQQKEIYSLCRRGLTNKEIAVALKINQKVVATQLSRIRKKAAALKYTYKTLPGAEHAQLEKFPLPPAAELKKRIRDDPGFFKLLFERYATNENPTVENRNRLICACMEPSLMSNTRSGQIKTIAACGACQNGNKLPLRIKKETRHLLRDYLKKQNLNPVQRYWDDGSTIYLVKPTQLKTIKQLLDSRSGYQSPVK